MQVQAQLAGFGVIVQDTQHDEIVSSRWGRVILKTQLRQARDAHAQQQQDVLVRAVLEQQRAQAREAELQAELTLLKQQLSMCSNFQTTASNNSDDVGHKS